VKKVIIFYRNIAIYKLKAIRFLHKQFQSTVLEILKKKKNHSINFYEIRITIFLSFQRLYHLLTLNYLIFLLIPCRFLSLFADKHCDVYIDSG
jgi:hypothetical protein